MPADTRRRAACIVITGASSGLGAALALAYAEPGRVLGLIARRLDMLHIVAEACRARGAEVISDQLDVLDGEAVATWLALLDADHPIDLTIVNAGTFDGIDNDGRLEAAASVRDLLRTNLEAAIQTASAAVELMRPRRNGHIALICSLAGRHPLADAPVYSASKAGLAAYGEALRERLAPEGITVSVVLPGHIATPQTAAQSGPLPGLMSADAAAAIVRRGLERRRGEIVFPTWLGWLITLGRCLPWRLRAIAARSLRFTAHPRDRHNR